MEPTIFEKIIAREVPAEIVYEDADTIAFLDIAPNNPGHTLVVPKKRSRNVFDVEADSWRAVMETVRKLAPIVRDAVSAGGINITVNNEAPAGQVVFYTHVHIIPRRAEDGFKHFPQGAYAPGEAERVADAMRERLAT